MKNMVNVKCKDYSEDKVFYKNYMKMCTSMEVAQYLQERGFVCIGQWDVPNITRRLNQIYLDYSLANCVNKLNVRYDENKKILTVNINIIHSVLKEEIVLNFDIDGIRNHYNIVSKDGLKNQ